MGTRSWAEGVDRRGKGSVAGVGVPTGELPDRAAAVSSGRRAPTTTAASAAIAEVVASTCSAGDAVSSTNTQSEPATARSSATTDASKATPWSSRICTSAVGSSGTPGSTRSSWTRRGHRLARYELSGGTGAGMPAIRDSPRWWHCGSTAQRFGRSGA